MRLFVAVWPPDGVVQAVAAVADDLRARPEADAPGLRWTRAEQWHVTMRFLGSVSPDHVDALHASLASVAAGEAGDGAASVDVVLGGATRAFGRSVLIVPVDGLGALAAAVVAATANIGEPPDDRPFSGHLTLARARARDRRAAGVRAFTGAPVPAMRWTVDELTLVRSITSSTGATYDVIGRWPLLP